jgi:peptidylprolyl isomerase/peptidyl-prolyl cis-trans isomerase C
MHDASPYLMLKLAQELFKKSPEALDDGERQRVTSVASRQTQIEQRILSTDEAMRVMLPEDSLTKSLAEIRNRYPSDDEFQADLERHRLSPTDLRNALRRELTVEAVLERVASRSAKVSDTDVEIFYLTNSDRFRRPETRRLSQILITINDGLADNERPAALAKIESIRARLLKSPERFAEQALKHSECPTAMHGGSLGEVAAGKLYPELEPVAFALEENEIGAIAESPLGFHLLRCDAIFPEHVIPLRDVRERIRTHLQDARRNICQKAWIGELFRKNS